MVLAGAPAARQAERWPRDPLGWGPLGLPGMDGSEVACRLRALPGLGSACLEAAGWAAHLVFRKI